MKVRPMLFSAPMVRVLLDGSKTQTRRVVKTEIALGREALFAPRGKSMRAPTFLLPDSKEQAAAHCPYGQTGDRLWVREAFSEGIHQMAGLNHWAYAADQFGTQQRLGDRWKPSIHMPRAASRITLEITGVRVERLQDISVADALAEGVKTHPDHHRKPRESIYSPVQDYRDLWESINGPDSWDANHWVWVIEFNRVEGDAA